MNSERLACVFAQFFLVAGTLSQVTYACSDPTPPEHMVVDLAKSDKQSAADGLNFTIGQTAFFKCKDGYVMKGIWWTLAAECHMNDTWVWTYANRAYCEKVNSLCRNGTFTCHNGEKIECSKTCDCNLDCSDRSDEGNSADCGPYIMVNATKKRNGILKSPGFPNGYPGQLSCTFKIFTSDPNSHVSLNFNTFDLRSSSPSRDSFTGIQTDSCKDYLKLKNNKYISKYKVHCSGMMYDYFGSCSAWCGGTSPPKSESNSNFILLEFHTSTSTREHKGFSASWTSEHDHRRSHSDSKSNILPKGAKIGIIVGAVVLVVAVTAVFVYWRMNRSGQVLHVPLHNVI